MRVDMRDVLAGFRQCRRAPALAAAAILSIGLGVGATTAIFGVVRHVLLRPLPFPEPDRLVMAWETSPDNPSRWVAPANFLDWRRDSAHVFEALAAFDTYSAALTGGGAPERVRGISASGAFFTTLGQPPAAGRLLGPDDDRPGAPCVAVLSDGLRARRFGGTSPALGATLVLDGRPCAVVGVLPASFSFPLQPATDIWTNGDRGVPRAFPFPGDVTTVRDSHLLFVLGRLRPGMTVATAERELQAVMARLAVAYPDTNTGLGAHVDTLQATVVGDVRPVLILLQVTVVVLLLVASANVAHLLLGQLAARRRELAVRAALGARRGVLVRQVLGEALALALPGALVGLLLAVWGLDLLVALAPPSVPRLSEVAIDPVVLGFGLLLTCATTLAFALVPAVGASAPAVAPMLDHGHRVAGRRHSGWHRALVVGELALAHLLVVAALLLSASLLAATRVDLGFAATGRLTAQLNLARDPYQQPVPGGGEFTSNPRPRQQLIDAVLTRMAGTPGVRAVAASFTAPLGGAPNRGVGIEGAPEPPRGQEPDADFQAVSPEYFRTLGITVLEGRAFTAMDDARAPAVAIVNRAFAARYLEGRSAIGRVVRFGGSRRHQIVGVVGDARNRQLERAAEPAMFVPFPQNDESWPFLAVTVWTDGDPAALAPQLRAALTAADPNQPISSLRPVDDVLAEQLAPRRFTTGLVALFGLLALVLATIGAYGVLSLSVSTRTREIAVRSALGASAARLRGLVLAEATVLVALAITIGLALALAAARLGQSLLFQVSTTSPALLASAAAVVVVPALIAAYLPAARAARSQPIDALRAE